MVEGVPHHQPRLLDLKPAENGIGDLTVHLGRKIPPAERLLPHEDAVLVAQVEEALRLRIVRSADEVAADRLQELDVAQHQILRGRCALVGMRLVAVNALQEERLAVQQEMRAVNADFADPEPRHAPIDGNRVEVRRLRRPGPALRHEYGGTSSHERRGDFARAVEDKRGVEVSLREVYRFDFDEPLLEIPRSHAKPAVVERKRQPVEESAEGVEVVAREEKPVRADVDAVVHCGLDDVPPWLERTRRELDAAPRQLVDADVASIKPELRPQARTVDNQPRGGDVPIKLECAAVEAGPLFHEPLRHHVKATGHGHRVRRDKVRDKRRFGGLPFLKSKLPRPVQVDAAKASCGTN